MANSLDMDALLDEVIARKGAYKYQDGFSEENWEEEMERVPLFMTTPLPAGDNQELSPALAALQSIKYDDGTPEDRALAFKEEGNALFRRHEYRAAVKAYSEGLAAKAQDSEMNAVLYTNRANAQHNLGNYRSALMDCAQALKYNPGQVKAIYRAGKACFELGKFTEVVRWCDQGLACDAGSTCLLELRSRAAKQQKVLERDQRKASKETKKKAAEAEALLAAIKARGVPLAANDRADDTDDKLTEVDPFCVVGQHPYGRGVTLSSDGSLTWPVLLLYPEYGQSDFIESFHEDSSFSAHLSVVLAAPAPWDKDHCYRYGAVEVYYEEGAGERLVQVPLHSTLNEVLSSGKYTVTKGLPSFIVLPSGSAFRQSFLGKYTR